MGVFKFIRRDIMYKLVYDKYANDLKVAKFQRDSGGSIAVWIFAFAPLTYQYGVQTEFGRIMNTSHDLFTTASSVSWVEQKQYSIV